VANELGFDKWSLGFGFPRLEETRSGGAGFRLVVWHLYASWRSPSMSFRIGSALRLQLSKLREEENAAPVQGRNVLVYQIARTHIHRSEPSLVYDLLPRKSTSSAAERISAHNPFSRFNGRRAANTRVAFEKGFRVQESALMVGGAGNPVVQIAAGV
jgi:hypothetical protein